MMSTSNTVFLVTIVLKSSMFLTVLKIKKPVNRLFLKLPEELLDLFTTHLRFDEIANGSR
jgi:hypothetical protein